MNPENTTQAHCVRRSGTEPGTCFAWTGSPWPATFPPSPPPLVGQFCSANLLPIPFDMLRIKEYNFSKGKRGAVIQPDPNKVRITIRFDADIVEYFKEQVHKAGVGITKP